eukprot:CAMPEP_0185844766 /NCGR_PEP_ID=MMETSP1354-20130828/884_1 /TAXON_ID=708628 /ORGANISM="Erythrolobus madagascarensis, Strain CCMP3276" /LENGTH=664 /DNA_ID=CAMNT_0028544541 /DNA_START=83 /DNA_END=2077 /DNA_ORIENTATION=-
MPDQVLDALRGLAGEAAKICVQCSSEFKESDVGDKSVCRFHTFGPEYGRVGAKHGCCGASEPCVTAKHRKSHHCEYPYEAFFPRANQILAYSDTMKEWASVSDTDLSSAKSGSSTAPDVSACVGKLLRWTSRGPLVNDDYLIVKVGRVTAASKHFFHTFSAEDLGVASTRADEKSLIFRNEHDNGAQYEQAEWIVEDGQVCGVRIECKAHSSPGPVSKEVRFSTEPLEVVPWDDDHLFRTVKDERFSELLPTDDGVYGKSLPEPIVKGATVPDTRKPRKDFARGGRGALAQSVMIQGVEKFDGGSSIAANREGSLYDGADQFAGCVSIVNTTEKPVLIVKATVEWRFVGEQEWNAVDKVDADGTTQVPLRCDPMEATEFTFNVFVRGKGDKPRSGSWFNRSWVARQQPVRFRVTVEDVSGSTSFAVLEYVQPRYKSDLSASSKESTLLSMSLYHPYFDSKYAVEVEKGKPGNDSCVIRVGSSSLSVMKLRQLACAAVKSGEAEQSLSALKVGKEDKYHEWNASALVDIACRRVYAIKVILKLHDEYGAATGYAAVPLYGGGENQARVDAALVTQHESSVSVDEAKLTNLPQDDDFDNVEAESAGRGTEGAAGVSADPGVSSGRQVVLSAAQFEALHGKMGEISENLNRIAHALDLVAGAMARNS